MVTTGGNLPSVSFEKTPFIGFDIVEEELALEGGSESSEHKNSEIFDEC